MTAVGPFLPKPVWQLLRVQRTSIVDPKLVMIKAVIGACKKKPGVA